MVGKSEKQKRKEARDHQRSKEKLANAPFGPIKMALMSEAGEFFKKSGLSGMTSEAPDLDQFRNMGLKVQDTLQKIAATVQTPKGENNFEDLFGCLGDKFALFSRNGIHGMTPSHDLCEMFKNTDITVDAEYFKLPYQVFVIKLPDNAFNFHYVILNMSPNDEGLQLFFTGKGIFNVMSGNSSQHTNYLLVNFPLVYDLKIRNFLDTLGHMMGHEGSKLESLFSSKYIKLNLKFDEGHEIFEDAVIDLIRISINSIFYLNSKKPEEIVVRKEAPTKNKPVLRPDIEMNEYSLAQQIKIKKIDKQYEKGEGKGSPVTPHWRRGHWRTQHHGQGNKEVKQIFIQPVYINLTYFKGDKADTGTSYE